MGRLVSLLRHRVEIEKARVKRGPVQGWKSSSKEMMNALMVRCWSGGNGAARVASRPLHSVIAAAPRTGAKRLS
jgi:enhancing lycopene biosynthesis protein 2